ncbi:hypothetical protein HSB1_46210 [Halogranum salarium B-1]|uniref:Uncharacterized protein n=1 Tax=Halogranum salarium B-1 TaxID=1210908 RepID=J2Z9D0_9EURY|nr:hypothetical protein HSB1_46210 [Halogranum salarium B-1]
MHGGAALHYTRRKFACLTAAATEPNERGRRQSRTTCHASRQQERLERLRTEKNRGFRGV